MIAMITPSGAFLYDMAEKQADEYANGKGFSCYSAAQFMKGWIFHSNDLPGIIRSMGVYICYVNLEEMSDGEKTGYFKTTIDYLSYVWRLVFLKNN